MFEIMTTYADLEALWCLPIPSEVETLLKIDPCSYVLFKEERVRVPWPPFTPDEIARARNVADDWEIPKNHVPLMGDFHDLVCLSFDNFDTPHVVIINDERVELARFASIKEFITHIQKEEELPLSSTGIGGVIEKESWLDF